MNLLNVNDVFDCVTQWRIWKVTLGGEAPKARASVERRWREGVGFGEEVSPSPLWEGSGEGASPLPRNFFLDF